MVDAVEQAANDKLMDNVEYFEEANGLLQDKVAILEETLAITELEKATVTKGALAVAL